MKIFLYKEINRIAWLAFNQDENMHAAFSLFQLNQKLYDNAYTSHNFGVFIAEEGWLESTEVYDAKEIALQYLLRASTMNDTYSTSRALGEVYLQQEKYAMAESSFYHALQFYNTSIFQYKLGVSLFMQQKYSKANSCFKKSLNTINSNDEYKVLLTYAFSCFFDRHSSWRSVVRQTQDTQYNEQFSSDTIRLAYLSGDFSFILEQYQKIYKEWKVEEYDFYMISDVLLKQNLQKQYMEWINYCNYLELGFLFDETKTVCVPQFFPVFLYQCNYIDCPLHPNIYQ